MSTNNFGMCCVAAQLLSQRTLRILDFVRYYNTTLILGTHPRLNNHRDAPPPLSAGDAENEILDEMLKTGVIEPSTSEWALPVCLVKKPDGSYRFCIDYRRVNAVSRKDGFPIPDIQDTLDSLRGAKGFATLICSVDTGS